MIAPFGWSLINPYTQMSAADPDDEAAIFLYCKSCEAKLYSYNTGDGCFLPTRLIIYQSDKKKISEIKDSMLNSPDLSEEQKAVNQKLIAFAEADKCPICGGDIIKHPFVMTSFRKTIGYTNDQCKSMDEIFSYFMDSVVDKEYTIPVLLPRMEKEISDKMTEWDTPVSTVPTEKSKEIKRSTEKLEEYLLWMIHLETNVYALGKRLQTLYLERFHANSRIKYLSRIKTKEQEEAYAEAENHLNKLSSQGTVFSKKGYPPKPAEPFYEKPGLFNKAKVNEKNALLKDEYEKALAVYQNEKMKIDELNQRLEQEAQQKHLAEINSAKEAVDLAKAALENNAKKDPLSASPQEGLFNSLVSEIESTENLLKETLQCRNELYAYDIVFVKYRNIVAIATFYEYLKSGRCTTLEGTDGAYNIYENEIRADRIISQLSSVLIKLDEIKENQYMLYSELQSVNASLSRLNDKMDKAVQSLENIESNTAQIAESAEQIAYNTEAAAFYSKKNAELTDALGFMTALK